MCGLGSYAFWMDMYVSLCDKRCNVVCLDECVCVCVCVCEYRCKCSACF